MAHAYPENPSADKQFHTRNFLNSLHAALPCLECEGHCNNYIIDNPPPVHNAKALQKWAYNFHEAVNKRLGKPSFSWEDCQKRYYKYKNTCS